jgi:SAM-dependent methyltransferase
VNECRNCGQRNPIDLGSIGIVQPFFLKRVFGMELRTPRSPNMLKQKIRELVTLPMSWMSRITNSFAFLEMQLCNRCSFIQTKIPFHDEDIARLYRDYRAPSYNQERISYEPEYADIASAIGQANSEVSIRRTALKSFIYKVLHTSDEDTILDYGGADGRFIPDIPGNKFVYEISSMVPIPGVTRIQSESELNKYTLVLFAHVLEHVTHPLDILRKLNAYVKPGGYLYIETPQEISDEQRAELLHGAARIGIGIHEHINFYCVPAVAAVLKGAGFTVAAIESEAVDVGWAKSVHIRALGRKPLPGLHESL